MSGSIFDDFLAHCDEGARALAAESDVMRLYRMPAQGVGLWVAEFDLPYLTLRSGAVAVASGPLAVAVRFGPDYLRQVSPLEVVQVREVDVFHPNIRWPVVCVGGVRPGMPLPQVLRHVYEILTYQNYATDDGLNPLACLRLCQEPELLNLLPSPPRLVRRKLDLRPSC